MFSIPAKNFIKKKKADIGFAVDSDADRLAIVDENGHAVGEELTLALAVKYLPLKECMGNNMGMDYGVVNPFQFVRLYLGYMTAILLCLAGYGYIVSRKQIKFTSAAKLFGLLLLCFAIPLSVGIFLNISASSVRMALDLASIIALIVACLLGVLLDIKRGGWFKDAVTYTVVAGVCITLFSWLRYG